MSRDSVETRIQGMEKQISSLRILCIVQFLLFASAAYVAFTHSTVHAKASDVLHTHGLVIEDENGRARVLLGAPFPVSKDRVRQDGTTEAMIFLDDKGRDRLTLGEEPDPQIQGKVPNTGHRIAPGFGVLIHDNEGNERGGYGWLGNGRAVLSLDRKDGDAWAAIVDDSNGFAGTLYEYPQNIARGEAITIGTQGKQVFLRMEDEHSNPRASLSLDAAGNPKLASFDEKGKAEKTVIP